MLPIAFDLRLCFDSSNSTGDPSTEMDISSKHSIGTSRPGVTFCHLDAVVSRLRRKFEQITNLPSAIKVVYGVG